MIIGGSTGYDIAQICLNGHKVNASVLRMPHLCKEHCDRCGEKTIHQYPACQASIRGYLTGTYVTDYEVPLYCPQCGQPYPWTESMKEATLELFAEVLDMKAEEQKDELRRDLDAIATQSPRAEVATFKMRRLIGKVGKEAASMLRDGLVNLGATVLANGLFPGG